jgi:hypothetical protein
MLVFEVNQHFMLDRMRKVGGMLYAAHDLMSDS